MGCSDLYPWLSNASALMKPWIADSSGDRGTDTDDSVNCMRVDGVEMIGLDILRVIGLNGTGWIVVMKRARVHGMHLYRLRVWLGINNRIPSDSNTIYRP